MAEGSSDSDLFTVTRPKSLPNRHRNANNNNAVDVLASTLQDTNRNLRTVDKMLDSYKEYGEQQNSAMDKLREDLARTTERLRTEKIRKARRDASKSPVRAQRDHSGRRYPTSPLKDYDYGYDKAASDNEYEGGPGSPSRRRSYRGAVRFFDDMDADESMHELHQSIRDLHSGQFRLEDDVQRTVNRSNRFEYESAKTMKTIAETLKNNTVEQRLKSLQTELSSERQLLKQNQDDVGQISTKLSQAIHEKRINKEENVAMKSRVNTLESERNVITNELEKTRTRLDRMDGAKTSLMDQVDDLRRALLKSEEGKQKLKEQIEKQEYYIRERQRKLSLEERDKEHQENEVRRMQDEIKELRHQLNKSAAVLGEFGDMRKELDRSEKQRQQLSDHIEVLGKDMEDRERQSAKMIHQLQSVSEQFNVADKQRTQLEDNLEDAIRKLKETSKQSENTAVAFRETQQQLQASEQKNQELKFRAQDTVKQWKAKCKKLEKELAMFQHSAEHASTRSEQLIKELEVTKNQSSLTAHQTEHMRREFNTLLAIRAQQEEEVRVRDVQVNELKSFKGDLERDLRDCKVVIERLEHELLRAREKSSSLFEDKNKYEDNIRSMQQSNMLSQSQFNQLQRELKELNISRVELSAQLATATSEKAELRAALKEARGSEYTSREEIDHLLRRIKDDKNLYNERLEGVMHELGHYRNGESHKLMELTHARKKQQAEYEAELQAVRLDLQEEKSNTTLLKRQNEKLKLEVERLCAKLSSVEEDLADSERKYHMVRGEFMSRTEVTEDGLLRSKQLELDLLDQKETFRRAVRDNHNVLHTIAAEIDGVVEVATMDSIETYKALSFTKNPSEPNSILVEVKAKLYWLKNEIRERRARASNITTSIKDTIKSTENDQNFLFNEISRQSDIMEQIAYSKRDPLDTLGYETSYKPPAYGTATYPTNYGPLTYTPPTYEPSTLQSRTDPYPLQTFEPLTTQSQSYKSELATYRSNTIDTPTVHSQAFRTEPKSYRSDTYKSQPSNFQAPLYKQEPSTFQSQSHKRVTYEPATYESETFSTPISTDTELQMEDLTVIPERLSKAQVFEAVHKMTSSASDTDPPTEHSDNSVLRKTHEERHKIHQRYAKLQGTLNSLREELSDHKIDGEKSGDSLRMSRSTARDSVSTSPSRRPARRVRISSPPTEEFSPVRRSNPSSRENSPRRSVSVERDSRKSHSRDHDGPHSRDPSLTRRSLSRERDSHRSHSRDRDRYHSRDRSPTRETSHSRDRESHKSHSSHRDRSHSHDASPTHDSRRSHSLDRDRASSHRSHSRERSPSRRSHDRSPRRSVSEERSPCTKTRTRSPTRRSPSPTPRRRDGSPSQRARSKETSPSRRFRHRDVSALDVSPSREKTNPMMLTDEDFMTKFISKSPPGLREHEQPVK